MNNQLNKLFQDGEHVWTGTLFSAEPLSLSEFFCINPLKSLDERNDSNVATKRNFLIEWDEAPLEEQYTALEKLKSANFPVTTATFSGSKSLHLIVSLADSLTAEYKAAWLALSLEIHRITGLNADPSCKNPSRLSRLAGAVRTNGIVQALLYEGKLAKNEYVCGLIQKHQINSSSSNFSTRPPVSMELDMSLDSFKLKIKREKGLHMKIMNAQDWIGPVNNYPELLKITLWAIDSTGVPLSTFKQYCREYLKEKLDRVGYPEYKLDKAIENAYSYKF
jgi:competence transcription factor ComK